MEAETPICQVEGSAPLPSNPLIPVLSLIYTLVHCSFSELVCGDHLIITALCFQQHVMSQYEQLG
jgi:hypothetical protein